MIGHYHPYCELVQKNTADALFSLEYDGRSAGCWR